MELTKYPVFSVTIRHVQPSQMVTVKVSISKDGSVQDLKERIHAKTGVVPANQRVVFGGRIISDEETLQDLGIGNDSVLHMVARIVLPEPDPEHEPESEPEPEPEFGDLQIFGKCLNGRGFVVHVNYGTATVYDLKVGISDESGHAVDDIRIILCGTLLENNVSLRDTEILNHAHFHIIFR